MKCWIFWRYIWFPTQPGSSSDLELFKLNMWSANRQPMEWMIQAIHVLFLRETASNVSGWKQFDACKYAHPICFFGSVVFNVGWGSSLLILRIAFLNSYCLAVLGESCWLNRDGSILLEEKFDFSSWDRSSSGRCLQAYKTATVGTKSRSCRCCEITKLTADALV